MLWSIAEQGTDSMFTLRMERFQHLPALPQALQLLQLRRLWLLESLLVGYMMVVIRKAQRDALSQP